MSIEKAMITQAPPYMVAAMTRKLIGEEVLKGCRPEITLQPVSLEPNFYPSGHSDINRIHKDNLTMQ